MLGEAGLKPAIGLVSRPPAPVEIATPDVAVAAVAPEMVEPKAVAASQPAPVAEPDAPAARGAVALQNPKDVLVTAAAATLLLVGLLSLPGLFSRGDAAPTAVPTATLAAPVAAAPEHAALPVVNVLRLPNGLTFESVETATGTQTVVADIPAGAETTLQVGDALLVYTATGEMLGTETALRDILQREFLVGVTTYGFVIRRGATTMDAEFRLAAAE